MATKFVKQATQQLAPVYAKSEKAITSQVPAIQKLYDTLITGLQGQYNTQLETGVQGIAEDASARGVARSTLPVDARTTLTTQLGQALLEGRGKLESQRMGDIAGINERVANLRIQRVQSIQDLARALQAGDLSEREFKFRVQQAKKDFALKERELAIAASRGGGGGGNTPQWQINQGAIAAMQQDILGDKDLMYSSGRPEDVGKGFLSPERYKYYRKKWRGAGLKTADFDNNFREYANPKHLWDYGLE